MKKQIFILLAAAIFLVQNTVLIAQDMYGTTTSGGQSGAGSIYKVDSNGKNLGAVYHFKTENKASQPYYSNPCELNGKIYGTTYGGGNSQDRGTLYEFDIATGNYTIKYNFNFANGSKPQYDPIVAKNGKLYGLTTMGGQSNRGALYEFDPTSGVLTLRASMNELGNGASAPTGQLIETTNNVFYGVTTKGGDSAKGVLFKYDLTLDSIEIVHHFALSSGAGSTGNMIYASNGKIYGNNTQGSNNNRGGLWEFDPNTNLYTEKYQFPTTGTFAYPSRGFIEPRNGILYGLTFGGNGAIYTYDINNDSVVMKVALTTSNGTSPFGGLAIARNGKIYAMPSRRGGNNHGTLIEYDTTSNSVTKLMDFGNSSGKDILGTPMIASNGKLYGTTRGGGSGERGVFFEYDLNGNKYDTKFNFMGMVDGGSPQSGLIKAKDKKLYGLTALGGEAGQGVLFSFDPRDSTYTKLVDFIDSIGSRPSGMLLEATDGMLYGMTPGGGSQNGGGGVIFKFDPNSKQYSVLVRFDYGKSGVSPQGSLIQASNGKLYGMAGVINKGSLFEYTIGEDSVVVKHDFVVATGNSCYGSLMEASNGKLYGMTRRGGDNNIGVMFEFDLNSDSYRVISHFNGTENGSNPYGKLVEAKNGSLYGMTYGGGKNGLGVLFEYNSSADSVVVKGHFSHSVGRNPKGSLIQASNGVLYGYTGQTGTVVQYNIDLDSLTNTSGMSTSTGNRPHYGSLVQYYETAAPCNLDNSVTQNSEVLTSNATGVDYQWVDCNDGYSVITGATSNTFTAGSNGQYAVIVSTLNCSDTSSCYTVSGLGIESQSQSNQLQLFPNPTSGSFEIISSVEVNSISLIDISGNEILVVQGSQMDLSEFPPGMYFVKIRLTNQNETIYKRVIKK